MLNAGNYLGAVADLFYQARLAFYMGQIDSAESLCQQWKKKFAEIASSSDVVESRSAPEIPAARGLDVVQSIILLERDQRDEAEHLLVKTLELLGWGSWMELHGFVELAQLYNLRGNEAGVLDILQRMRRLGPQHVACAEALEILSDLKKSSVPPQVRSKAEAWTKRYSPNPSFPFALGIGPYHRDAEYFCNLFWAQVQIALGHFEQASTFIEPALQIARDCGLLFRVAELSIAHALIQAGQGNSAAALNELGKALEISETCGYIHFFDDSPELDKLLHQAAERKIHAPYARRLLDSFQSTRAARKIAGAIQKAKTGLVDPLSEREVEVLRLLADGSPPAEVAKKLYLSPFTLKAHTQNIYSKLGVHSRIEAINKAREMELL